MIILAVLLGACGALLLLPAAVLLVETLAALLPPRRSASSVDGPRPRSAVLIPAHNEAAQIAKTVRLLAPQLDSIDRLIVIADNCDDDTAARARAAGATVIERTDPDRRGKGFAIAFGLRYLDADPPDVVVLVDADCRVAGGGIPELARVAARQARPVQAEYLIGSPPNPSPTAVVSALAVLVRNRVRPRGLHRLGLPCHLTGSGMAFPFRVLRDAPETGANLVEDLVMGIEMALRGHEASFCPQVQISSELPDDQDAAMGQRRRWEHGQLHTLVSYFPRLVAAGFLRGRPGLIGLGCDLMVPPLALLVMLLAGTFMASLAAGGLGLTSFMPAAISGFGLAAVAVAIAAAWVKFGRQTAPLRFVLFVPFYVAWKIPLYLSLAIRGKQKTWVRTARAVETAASPPRGGVPPHELPP